MSETIALSPEYIAKHSFNAQVREAQRVRLWGEVYASVVGPLARNPTSSHHDDAVVASTVATLAVEEFDKRWGPK